MSNLAPHPRPRSSASIASNTTYHSFLNEPALPCTPARRNSKDIHPHHAHRMHRQDSGYESMTRPSPPPSSRRRASTSVASSSSGSRAARPPTRRAARSGPVIHSPRPSSTRHSRSTSWCPQAHYQEEAYSHYPFPYLAPQHHEKSSDTTIVAASAPPGSLHHHHHPNLSAADECPPPPPCQPPATTHYWTSDSTRRLEYAAIDAASRGVRGWVMRHMVPDCLIPEERRRVRFDDDSRSVVRYRLDLDGEGGDEDEDEKRRSTGCGSAGGRGTVKKRRSRWFGGAP